MDNYTSHIMKLHKTQHPVDDLEEAKRVLGCLEHLTIFYNTEAANPPDEEFYFGYSTILGYVNFNVVNAIEKLNQKDKEHIGKETVDNEPGNNTEA